MGRHGLRGKPDAEGCLSGVGSGFHSSPDCAGVDRMYRPWPRKTSFPTTAIEGPNPYSSCSRGGALAAVPSRRCPTAPTTKRDASLGIRALQAGLLPRSRGPAGILSSILGKKPREASQQGGPGCLRGSSCPVGATAGRTFRRRMVQCSRNGLCISLSIPEPAMRGLLRQVHPADEPTGHDESLGIRALLAGLLPKSRELLNQSK